MNSVQIVENWSQITGTITEISRPEEPRGYRLLTIAVDNIEPVADYPELVSKIVDDEAQVYVPDDVCTALQLRKGTVIACRVRRGTSGKLFAHPEHIEVLRQGQE